MRLRCFIELPKYYLNYKKGKMKKIIYVLPLLLLFSCTKKGANITFNIVVLDNDGSPPQFGFVRIIGYKDTGFSAWFADIKEVYEHDVKLSEKGVTHHVMPYKTEYDFFKVKYHNSPISRAPQQTLTGCELEGRCEIADGQGIIGLRSIFDVEIVFTE